MNDYIETCSKEEKREKGVSVSGVAKAQLNIINLKKKTWNMQGMVRNRRGPENPADIVFRKAEG